MLACLPPLLIAVPRSVPLGPLEPPENFGRHFIIEMLLAACFLASLFVGSGLPSILPLSLLRCQATLVRD